MKKFLLFNIFIICFVINTHSQARWAFDLNFEDVYNVPMPLTIKQKGYSDLKFVARFTADAFTPPVCWDWRFSRWENGKSWEIEAIHDKLYLINTNTNVSKYSISHGFNIITLNRGIEKKFLIYKIGFGAILAHPESVIRGMGYGSSSDYTDFGYFLTGPITMLSVCKPIKFCNRFYFNLEAKTSFAYSHIRVAKGYSNLFNFAFHIGIGMGFDFIKPAKE
jgi:hypothetical protein